MASGIVKRCSKCGKDASRLGSRLKKCVRCASRGLEYPYCSKECQTAHWQIHKIICCNKNGVVLTGLDSKRLRGHLDRWFAVYKPALEWALHQVVLLRVRDMDTRTPFLNIELEYAPGDSESNVPRLRLARLTTDPLATVVQMSLPDPQLERDAKMMLCNLKEYDVVHKCAGTAFATFRDEPLCPRWNYVLADMVSFGFQDQTLLIESLHLAITRHFTFEAFLGPDSHLRAKPFPCLSQSMPPNLNISPWIWIKDVGFIRWFEKETGMTITTRLAELQAQTRRDSYTENLVRWVTDPFPPTLEDFWRLMSARSRI